MRRSRRTSNVFFMFSALLFILILFMAVAGREPASDPKTEYLAATQHLAQKVARDYGLFPSVTLAQSALESNYGQSELSRAANNYFGIKSTKDAPYVEYATQEYEGTSPEQIVAKFRSYDSKWASFEHYATLLTRGRRYSQVKDAANYVEAARAIQQAGYATDPNYADKVISIIERYDLDALDEPQF
ncbi:glycoside hydrolase family 73 protein [Peptoniphilus equinus]|uniref:Glycoside hydrolase family 73 protein n=1 Tax=Peptoniphilus equinus TaxID=3016343 RepID=A0ABY7QSW4_9FIRM|nr:glycoside hydrolase family 73 protein [Peptoniphilus equinus]WBW49879.1 glycoside hydrolase family 73 protein [Peptoniphilus equinus]